MNAQQENLKNNPELPDLPRRQSATSVSVQERLARAQEKAWLLHEENKALKSEIEQRRLAEKLARDQSAMLIQSMDFLATESHLDTYLGHVLKTTVDQLEAIGGTLWFPDYQNGTARLHLEYVSGKIVPARESLHPAVLHPPPIGGVPLSTFPALGAETYVLCYEVSGMPEQNREYIMSLGVRTLLTVPMYVGAEHVGWMCIRSNRTDTQKMSSQIRVAEALASQAALAIQMASLSEKAREAAVLEERNRIARDIHDTLAQGFTGVLVNLEASSRALKKQDNELAATHIEHARELAQGGLEQARNSVRTLRPRASPPASLVSQLQYLAKMLEETGALSARFLLVGEVQNLSEATVIEMLRIAQESTTNVLKHAKASDVLIELAFAEAQVVLSIVDNDDGFKQSVHHEGFGLIGMHERAQRIGATLTVASMPGSGTRITLTVMHPRHA